VKLGRYRLVRRIAVGGMAELFEARDTDDTTVVVKVVLPQHARDPEFVQMLADEARLTMRLHHPNLVRVLEYGHEGDQHFMVMEYVRGPTLAALLQIARQAGRPPSPALALQVAAQLTRALGYLHGLPELQVVHRDVTPANVLVDRDSGQVKLGDFGIAQHNLRQTRTRSGVIKGTVQYMAPEQVTGSGIDARTDLYGVGLILFELLTLRPFIHAEREVDLLRLAEEPPWIAPSALRPELQPLDRLLRRCLGRFPEERFPDADALMQALDQARATAGAGDLTGWIDDLPAAASDEPAMIDLPQPAGTRVAPLTPPRRRWVLVWALLGALPLAAISALWMLVLRPDENPASSTHDSGAWDGNASRLDLPAPDQRSPTDLALPSDLTRPDRNRRPTPRRPVRVAIALDAAIAPPDTRRRERLLARLRTLRTDLERRGVLVVDLPLPLRARLERLPGMDTEALATELDTLEPTLSALRVTRALVEAKIRHVDQRLRAGKGQVPQALRDQASQALQEFMDGRYVEANRQLNRILQQVK